MISLQLYEDYLSCLLKGKKELCGRIVESLLDQDVLLKTIYRDLFQESLYAVGELWEHNKISVAKEHLATAITESLMGFMYPRIFESKLPDQNKTILVSCAANEYHQIGGRMVADLFEINGWDAHFLGANTPIDSMLEFIQEENPDLIGLSLSIPANLHLLETEIDAIRSNFNNMDILIGGQAFRWGDTNLLNKFSGIFYIQSIDALEQDLLNME